MRMRVSLSTLNESQEFRKTHEEFLCTSNKRMGHIKKVCGNLHHCHGPNQNALRQSQADRGNRHTENLCSNLDGMVAFERIIKELQIDLKAQRACVFGRCSM